MAAPDLIFGLHAVTAALRHHPERVEVLWYDSRRRDKALRAIVERAQAQGVPAEAVHRKELDHRAPDARHQGVVARARPRAAPGEPDLADVLGRARAESPLLLALDGVQDPHNLGACLRTADAAGVAAVIVPKDRAVGLTPTVAKVASGAAETVPLIPVTNLARTLEQLQQAGVWVVGLADDARRSLYQVDLTGPLALVLGAEGKGLRRLTRERCDFLARIPQVGTVSSLNVSVATGVCLFEARRQRNP